MYLVVFDGIMGAGKTMAMTLLANYFKELSAIKGLNVSLYSNYEANNTFPFTHLTDFLHVQQQESSIVCLDESHIDLDSRSFSSNAVKYFTHMIFYLRKLRCTMFMTSPLFSNLDTRVQAVTNIYIHCYSKGDYFYYELYDVQRNSYLRTLKLKQSDAKSIAGQYYDSHSFVTPLEYPETKKEYDKFLFELKHHDTTDLARKQLGQEGVVHVI